MSLDWSYPTQPCEAIESQLLDISYPESLQESSLLDYSGDLETSVTAHQNPLSPSNLHDCTCHHPFTIFCSEHGFTLDAFSSMEDWNPNQYPVEHYAPAIIHWYDADSSGQRHFRHTTNNSVEARHAYDETELSSCARRDGNTAQIKPRLSGNNQSQRRRSKISASAKRKLEIEFATNPYPSAEDFCVLATDTNLPLQTVRTWFNNARSRKYTTARECMSTLKDTLHFLACY